MYLESVRVAIDTSFHDDTQLGHQRGQNLQRAHERYAVSMFLFAFVQKG
jgi:hypothetical protein